MGGFEAWCARSRSAVLSGPFQEAETAYRAAIGLNPQDLKAHLELSVVLRRCRKPAEAESVLRTALELDPHSPTTLFELGVARFEQGKFGAAAGTFRELTQIR